MSEDTRQLIEVLLCLAPWLAFAVALLWSAAVSLVEDDPEGTTPARAAHDAFGHAGVGDPVRGQP